MLKKHDKPLPKTHSGLVAKLWEYRKELNLEENIIRNLFAMAGEKV